MLKLLTASTEEIDDADLAVKELFDQLNLSENALKNSVALVYFHREFYDAGVAKAVIDRLPMPAIGGTAHGSGDNRAVSIFRLTVAVLTADDAVNFAVASAEINNENYARQISAAYQSAREKLAVKPRLMVTFNPFNPHLNGDLLLNALTAAAGKDIPVFGEICSQMPPNSEEIMVAGDHKISNSQVSLLLIGGDVTPRFFTMITLDMEMKGHRTGIVTKASGEELYEVDHRPAYKFFADCGVLNSDVLLGLPLLMDYCDGAPPSASGIFSIGEDAVRFNKQIPVGSRISPTHYFQRDSILHTAEKFSEKLASECDDEIAPVMLAFSCLARTVCLAPEEDAELKIFQKIMAPHAPFVVAYAGGEICPLPNAARTEYINRFHHYTWSICLLVMRR